MLPYGCRSQTDGLDESDEDVEIPDEKTVDDDEEATGEVDEYGVRERTRSDICAAFTLLDEDGDGRISPRTVEKVVTALGREPTEDNLRDATSYCSGSGMDFRGFYRYLGEQLVDTSDESKLREAMSVFGCVSRVDDPVPAGMTDLAELRFYLKHRGVRLTDDEIDYLWEESNYWMLSEKLIDTEYLIRKIMDG